MLGLVDCPGDSPNPITPDYEKQPVELCAVVLRNVAVQAPGFCKILASTDWEDTWLVRCFTSSLGVSDVALAMYVFASCKINKDQIHVPAQDLSAFNMHESYSHGT